MRVVLFVLLTVLLAEPALPCSCNPDRTTETEFADADVVFRGITVSREEFLAPDAEDFPLTGFRVRFRVTEVWKGEVPAEFTVISGPGNCRFLHEPGDGYLVFAARWPEVNNEFWTNRCHGTRGASKSEAEDLLGDPRRRYSGEPDRPSDE